MHGASESNKNFNTSLSSSTAKNMHDMMMLSTGVARNKVARLLKEVPAHPVCRHYPVAGATPLTRWGSKGLHMPHLEAVPNLAHLGVLGSMAYSTAAGREGGMLQTTCALLCSEIDLCPPHWARFMFKVSEVGKRGDLRVWSLLQYSYLLNHP